MKPVLILSEPGDAHALTVAARLTERHSCETFIWDASRFPARDTLTHRISASEEVVALQSRAIGVRALSQYRSVWWRRVRRPVIGRSVALEPVREHCRAESRALLCGAFEAASVPVINDRSSESRACRKPLQLATAVRVGLHVPETVITNDASEVRRFYKLHKGRIVFKPLTSRPAPLGGTQLVEPSYLPGLDLLLNSPVIFQEAMDPAQDVRVTVVGGQIFAGISSSAHFDWRLDPDISWVAHTLPTGLCQQILDLLHRLNLTIASLDFRLTAAGDYIFFEVNPNGQFLFLESQRPNCQSALLLLICYLGPGRRAARTCPVLRIASAMEPSVVAPSTWEVGAMGRVDEGSIMVSWNGHPPCLVRGCTDDGPTCCQPVN